jgi:hypothetical protein
VLTSQSRYPPRSSRFIIRNTYLGSWYTVDEIKTGKISAFRQTSVSSVCQNARIETIHFPINVHSWLHLHSFSQTVLASLSLNWLQPYRLTPIHLHKESKTCMSYLSHPTSASLFVYITERNNGNVNLIWKYILYNKTIPKIDFRCAFLLMSMQTYKKFTLSWIITHSTKYLGEKYECLHALSDWDTKHLPKMLVSRTAHIDF